MKRQKWKESYCVSFVSILCFFVLVSWTLSYQKRLEKTYFLKAETIFLEENVQDNFYPPSAQTSQKMKKNKV